MHPRKKWFHAPATWPADVWTHGSPSLGALARGRPGFYRAASKGDARFTVSSKRATMPVGARLRPAGHGRKERR